MISVYTVTPHTIFLIIPLTSIEEAYATHYVSREKKNESKNPDGRNAMDRNQMTPDTQGASSLP